MTFSDEDILNFAKYTDIIRCGTELSNLFRAFRLLHCVTGRTTAVAKAVYDVWMKIAREDVLVSLDRTSQPVKVLIQNRDLVTIVNSNFDVSTITAFMNNYYDEILETYKWNVMTPVEQIREMERIAAIQIVENRRAERERERERERALAQARLDAAQERLDAAQALLDEEYGAIGETEESYEGLLRLDENVVSRGALPDEIDSLPSFHLVGEPHILESARFCLTIGGSIRSTCSICLTDYKSEDDVTVLPCCHCYHEACVTNWLLINRTCPECRHDIREEF